MPASKKEEILAEAMVSFQTVQVSVGKTNLVLRELSVEARRQLNASIYVVDENGELVSNDKGGVKVLPAGQKHYDELWIAATSEPAFTVEELIPWPESLKLRLGDEARKVNGIKPAEETAKNS